MKLGDIEITRESMPAMQAWQMNPDHLRQSIQDVLNMKLSQPLIPPQGGMPPAQGTAEGGQNQWNM